jgi:hypothetical protein
VKLEDILNGAGPFVAACAIPMLLGLLIPSDALASRLRRFAIFLALALPIVFMALVASVYLANPIDPPFDFKVNYQATEILYRDGGDPYSVEAAYSFPFPTFLIYWIAGGLGALSSAQAWIAWWAINGILWAICAVLLWRSLPAASSPRERDLLSFAIVAIPAMTTLWQGQTAILILVGLVALHFGLQPTAKPSQWIIAGIGLAFASLIKPQLALIGMGLLLWGLLAWRAHRREDVQRLAWILGTALVSGLGALILTILIPGGVSLETYQRFLTSALPQVAQPVDLISVNGSPAYMLPALALTMGASSSTVSLMSNSITLIMLGLAALWTYQRADRPLIEIAAGWGVWAMVAPRVAWTWYGVWCLPFFLLAIQESRRGSIWRLVLIVLILGGLNLQVGALPIAFVTILLLIILLWTSFRETRTTQTNG